MKMIKPLLLSLGYALFGGLGFTCFLRVLALSASVLGSVKQYPRLIPFCVIVGIASLLICLGLLVLNIRMFGKEAVDIPMGGRIFLEITVTVLLFLPSAALWDKVLRLLSQIF